jgi:hypothetical protein
VKPTAGQHFSLQWRSTRFGSSFFRFAIPAEERFSAFLLLARSTAGHLGCCTRARRPGPVFYSLLKTDFVFPL